MKKLLALCILGCATSVVYADQCPNANDVFVYKNGRHIVRPPEGWQVYSDAAQYPMVFRVAAWGDHVSSKDSVRCHYYGSRFAHLELHSTKQYSSSSFDANPKWSGDESAYHLCTSFATNPAECAYG